MKSVEALSILFIVFLAPSAWAQQAQPDSPLRVVYNSGSGIAGEKDKLTVDIFWCNGDAKAQSRALSASELAGSLAAVSRLYPDVGSEIGQIRTRPIDRQAFLTGFSDVVSKAGTEKPFVNYDLNDSKARNIVMEFDKASVELNGQVNTRNNNTPNYFSAYLCRDVDPSQYVGQLYFQVQSEVQKQAAGKAIAALANEFPGLSVATGVEVVGDKSPPSSELRYFLEKDSDAAISVAGQLSSDLGKTVTPKFIAGYGAKIRPGSLEAWIADK